MPLRPAQSDEIETFSPLWMPRFTKPVEVHQSNSFDRSVIGARPYTSVLLFDNNDSDARDHAANERSASPPSLTPQHTPLNEPADIDPVPAFLSWLRLSVYMAVVSVAISVSFHLKHQPSDVERRLALPFGIVFWFLSLACLASGLMNYVKTITKFSRRAAIVQSGTATQIVFMVVAGAIVAACVLFLSTNADRRS